MTVFPVGRIWSLFPVAENREQEDMVVDPRSPKGIKEQDNESRLGKQPSETPLPVAITPTS